MSNITLFLIPALIWGSTWLAIKFQLGTVDPIVSVSYRFCLAGILLLIFCKIRGLNLRYSSKQHFFLILMGIFLFGLNYWMVYVAELTLPSGLVALIFSIIIFMNVFNGAIFLKSPVNLTVVLGGLIGIIGVFFIFKKEILSFNLSNQTTTALAITLISVFLASLGNIISARNQRAGLPVLQANVFGMLYGGMFTLFISVISGKHFSFEFSFSYIASLFFLAIFGSIIAFGCYLTLIGRIGADKAAYITFISPIFALILSTVFEGYVWAAGGILGVALILSGNLLVLWKKSNLQAGLFYDRTTNKRDRRRQSTGGRC